MPLSVIMEQEKLLSLRYSMVLYQQTAVLLNWAQMYILATMTRNIMYWTLIKLYSRRFRMHILTLIIQR